MSPTWPDPVRIRSAIVIVEMEDGSTVQSILTPEWWQPVEVSMEVDYETAMEILNNLAPMRPVWTLTITAGGYTGQLRVPKHTAEQAGPQAVES